MFDYIFTIGCFDKLHKGHIKLLESMKKKSKKIIVGLHDNNSISKIKNISDIDSYDNRKKNLEKYVYDVFMIDDVDPTKAIQEYISNKFFNSTIHQNKSRIKLLTDNFKLYGVPGNYLSQETYRKYNNNIIQLPIGSRAKHFYEDNEYHIYNERDKNKWGKSKYGRLIFSKKNLPYQCEDFNDILNNNINYGGSQDNRYIIFKNDLFVVFNGISKKDNTRQMFLYNLKQSKLCQLYINSYDISKITQKNWTPYVYEDNLYFIYSICELCVLKLISHDSGECEIVFGDPSKFTNKGLFGGSNLCYWKNNFYIGFLHSRNPHLCMPFLYDAKNYNYITTYRSIQFDLPFKINHKISCGTEEFPYYFRKISNKYELFLSYQDICSIKFEISTDAIDSLFTNLLNYNQLQPITIGPSRTNSKVIKNDYSGDLFFIHKYKDKFKYRYKDKNITVTRTDNNSGWAQNLIGYKKNWCFMRGNDNKNFPSIQYIKSIMPIQYLPYTNEIVPIGERYNFNNIDAINNTIKEEGLDILVVSYGGSCSNALVKKLHNNGYKCKTDIWKKYLCHCPTYINVNIPIIYIYDNIIKSFLSQRKRTVWKINQIKMSNNVNIELSDEMLLKLMIKQWNSWTNSNIDNLLVIKSVELFTNKIVNKLKNLLGKHLDHFPMKYRKPNINEKNIEDFKSTELFKKYKLDIEKIINKK